MWWFGPTMMLLFLAACGSIGYLVVRAVRPSRAIDIQREFEERCRILQV